MIARIRRDGNLWDTIAAAAFLVVGIADVVANSGRGGPLWANILIWIAVAPCVYYRRSRPLQAAYGFMALMTIDTALLTSPADEVLPLLGLLLFGYSVGAHAGGRWARVWPVAATALVVLVDVLADEITFGDVVFPSVVAIAAWAAGRGTQSRMRLAAELHEAALRAEEDREAEARRAMVDERARIAREMHDVVAHSISVMVVQAGGARRILDREPERAETAAADIERTGRQALLEMRRLLGVLRTAEDTGQLAPAPSFDGLQALVERARNAGLPVELNIEGAPAPLPTGIDLSAYRVVQEALTNVLEHAPGAPTVVTVRWLADALELSIEDRGPGPAGTDADHVPGQGLIGMRERVSLYGGDLRTGRRRGGGFEVHVRLPLDPLEESSDTPAPVAAQGAA